MHRYVAARDLDQDTLTRRRRLRGEDDPGTLISAAHREKVLSYFRKARESGAHIVTGGGVPVFGDARVRQFIRCW